MPKRSVSPSAASWSLLGWTEEARAGATLGAGSGPPGLLVIGGELGLCGGYNAHVVAAGAKRRAEFLYVILYDLLLDALASECS